MSLHRSLKGSSTIRVKRNVLKRGERVDFLIRAKRWKLGDPISGLPKTPGAE